MNSYSPVRSPPPPPPLPPPPPMSLGSPSYQISSADVVRPTTAGLLKFPSISESHQQNSAASNGFSPANNLSSQKFKDELREKHSHFSNTNSSSTIDERIKSQKEMNANRNMNCESNEQQRLANMPEKLLSTLGRQDVKPFSYTSGVNDPNNRGKLDLNQIKSPVMRRRLLANLDSTEDNEEDDAMASTIEQNEVFSPKSVTIKYFEPELEVNLTTSRQQHSLNSPIIRYNEPPQFYNLPQEVQTTYTNGVSRPKSALDELNDEVAKSLDSLSELVANIHTNQPYDIMNQRPTPSCTNSDLRHHTREPVNHLPDQRRSGRSTFLPGDVYNRGSDLSRHNSTSPAHQQARSMGDYLLSPDSNYFSTNSTSQPYSISPYYGSPLDMDAREYAFNRYPQSRPASGFTFSPDNRNTSPYDRCNTRERYY